MAPLHRITLAVALLVNAAPLSAAEGPRAYDHSGTYRGRVLTERFLHQQAVSRRSARLLVERPSQARSDQGDIAVIDTSNGVVPPPNFFDLQGLSVRFAPSGDGFVSSPEPLALDEAARANGVSLALRDDESVRVDLPFSFPFFSQRYQALWVNSDGNATFGEGDSAVAARSLARAVSGPPRIAPLFVDLDPSRTAARVRFEARPDRVFVTWDGVPQFSAAGTGRRQIFQLELGADGSIAFHYHTANLAAVVTGVFPGRLEGDPQAVDFSAGPTGPALGGLAELFQLAPQLDVFAASQQFYRNHDDAYEFIVLFNGLGMSAGPGSFAFEINVRNEVLGIGDLLSPEPVFDLGPEFGSPSRLESFLNMGPLSNYPGDPAARIPLIGENSTLSVLGQEAGHRWGVYLDFLNPSTGLPSSNLLGRQDAHWSFFFNSQASVLEGNAIADRGEGVSPRFETVETVSRFGDFDQYAMGLIGPADVEPSFLVLNPRNISGGASRSRRPETGVRFDGDRQDININMVIAAEGPRLPDHTVAQRELRFAFVLLVDAGAEPRPADVEKLDRIRREWEGFFDQGVESRGAARTQLVRTLRLSAAPAAGLLQGGEGPVRIELESPLADNLAVELTADPEILTAPSEAIVPAGERSASFNVGGLAEGVGELRAEAATPGFEASTARIQVVADPTLLTIEAESGAGQLGAGGELLPEPLVLAVRDHNRLRYLGVQLEATALGGGGASPPLARTDADGLAAVAWRLGAGGAEKVLRVRLAGQAEPSLEVLASAGVRPAFAAGGVVNAASFNQGPAALSPGLSPGGLTTIFGVNLADRSMSATTFPLPRELDGVQVRINGAPVPLLLVSPGQINFQAPYELTGTEVAITVESSIGASERVTVPVLATQPGVFTDASTGLAAIVYAADGLSPWHRPARAGEFLQIFTTGLGAVTPRTETGEAAVSLTLAQTLAAPEAVIGGRRLTPTFSGLAPFFAGLYQINVELPADLEPGPYELFVEIDGRSSNAGLIEVTTP